MPDGAHRPELRDGMGMDDDMVVFIDVIIQRAGLAIIDDALGPETARTPARPASIDDAVVAAILLQRLEPAPCDIVAAQPQRLALDNGVGRKGFAVPSDRKIFGSDMPDQLTPKVGSHRAADDDARGYAVGHCQSPF